MRAIDVMTRDVVTATPEMTVQDVAKLMINHRISGIPIVEGERQLVGIVTEGDLLRRSETGTERHHSRWSEWFSPNSRLAAESARFSHANGNHGTDQPKHRSRGADRQAGTPNRAGIKAHYRR